MKPSIGTELQKDNTNNHKFLIHLANKGPKYLSAPNNPTLKQLWENQNLYPAYIEKLQEMGVQVHLILKWQNALSGWCGQLSGCHVDSIARLPFVKTVRQIPFQTSKKKRLWKPSSISQILISPDSALRQQEALYNTLGFSAFFTKESSVLPFPGRLQTVSVIDNGFSLGHQGWETLKDSERILDQKDFVDTTSIPTSSQLFASHGSQVLSLLGIQQGSTQGIIPHANFLLYRAENNASETHVEEDYVAAAIERSVEQGAKVINISLGYRYDFDQGYSEHPYSYFDGTQSPASIAALQAARRNVLVVVAMGNENGKHPNEPNLTAPADADSILSVGAGVVFNNQYYPCSFSSKGPSFDGRLKPEVSAPGCAVPVIQPSTDSLWTSGYGTSFAAPIVTGMAALLWQVFPNQTAQGIRQALIQSGSSHMSPNDSIGHGLVNMKKAYEYLLEQHITAYPSSINSHQLYYLITSQRRPQYFGNIGKLSPKWDVYSIKGKLLFSINTQGKAVGEEVWEISPLHVTSQPVLIRVR